MTFSIELASKPDRNGFSSVMIRLYQTGLPPARLLTRVKVHNADKHWVLLDEKLRDRFKWGKWVTRHVDADALNAEIEGEFNRIKDLVKGWLAEDLKQNPGQAESKLTPKQIADRYKSRLSEAYFDLAAQVLENSKEQAFRTFSIKRTAVNAFANFAGEDLTLQAVDAAYIEKFQNYLKKYVSKKTGKKLKPSSINQYMESLGTVHKDILRLKGHSSRKAALLSPFPEVDKLPTKSTYRSKFDESEIEVIKKVKTESTRRRLKPDDAFSVWMLAHFLAGARCTDVLMWRYKDFETDESGKPIHLTYTMLKTGNVVSIPVYEEAQLLLARWWKQDVKPTDYILPYLDSKAAYAQYLTREEFYNAPFKIREIFDARRNYWNGQLNQVLAEIQDEANLKGDLRMHNARHSFADLARRIMETDKTLNPLDITLMLGQSDFRMTMKYLEELAKQDVSKPMKAVFGRKSNSNGNNP